MRETGQQAGSATLIGSVVANVDVALHAAILFGAAWTFHWTRAWIFLGVMAAARALGGIRIARVNTGLLRERARLPIQQGQPLADRVLLTLCMAANALLVAFIALDRFRFHLLPAPPAALTWVGLLAFLAGTELVTAALRANAFASMSVRHQRERGHVVADTGPYRVVRHPMYTGVIVTLWGMALWLESTAGVLAALLPIALLALRSVLEERFLLRELDGYAAYCTRTRYRIVPFVF